jgi:hypothetical protein
MRSLKSLGDANLEEGSEVYCDKPNFRNPALFDKFKNICFLLKVVNISGGNCDPSKSSAPLNQSSVAILIFRQTEMGQNKDFWPSTKKSGELDH